MNNALASQSNLWLATIMAGKNLQDFIFTLVCVITCQSKDKTLKIFLAFILYPAMMVANH